MNEQRWRRVQRLFAQARRVPAEERRTLLARVCGGEDTVISEVLRLLEKEDIAGSFLEPPADADLDRLSGSAAPGLEGLRLDDFELIEEIGRGAMGVVYSARQVSLNRKVALKILAQHLCASPERIERFRREALAASRLRHPNIVTILSFGEERRLHYIAMEHVGGKSLRELLADAHTFPDPTDVARIVLGVAKALDHCHGLGIIHRDIKPHNILLDEQGEPRLVDFGLAKDADLESISQAGSLLGTPHYMSPEQAQALGAEVDHRTDIYSAGAVLYELLTLHKPFEGPNSPAVLYSITHEKPKPIAEFAASVPTDLVAICQKAMGRRPESRYQTARDLVLDLERFLAGERVRAPRPSLLRQTYEVVFQEHRKAAAMTAVAGFSLLILLTPRQEQAVAAPGHAGIGEAAERAKPEVLLPPSRDEKVLQEWRKQMRRTISDSLRRLPQEPIDK